MLRTIVLLSSLALSAFCYMHCTSPFTVAGRRRYFFSQVDLKDGAFPTQCWCSTDPVGNESAANRVSCDLRFINRRAERSDRCASFWPNLRDPKSVNEISFQACQLFADLSPEHRYELTCRTLLHPNKNTKCLPPDYPTSTLSGCGRLGVTWKGSCYALVQQLTSFEVGRQVCGAYGGHLAYHRWATLVRYADDDVVVPDTKFNLTQVPANLSGIEYWIGLIDDGGNSSRFARSLHEPYFRRRREKYIHARSGVLHEFGLEDGDSGSHPSLYSSLQNSSSSPPPGVTTCTYIRDRKLYRGDCTQRRFFMCTFHLPFLAIDAFWHGQ